MNCQHGVNNKTHICPKCEAELAKFRSLTVTKITEEQNNARRSDLLAEIARNENLWSPAIRD